MKYFSPLVNQGIAVSIWCISTVLAYLTGQGLVKELRKKQEEPFVLVGLAVAIIMIFSVVFSLFISAIPLIYVPGNEIRVGMKVELALLLTGIVMSISGFAGFLFERRR